MPFDPISYSEVKKLEKKIPQQVEEALSEGVDTLKTNKIEPKDGNKVTIQGDLDVVGNVTYVETTNLQVKDNIIELNSGETGSGVTLGSAGITIDRGTEPDAQVIWDENNDKFVFKLEDGTKLPVEVSNLNADNVSSSSTTTDDLTVNTSATITGLTLGSDLNANNHNINNVGTLNASTVNTTNLSGATVTGDLIPDSDNSKNFGSSDKRWKNIYTTRAVITNHSGQEDWGISAENLDLGWGNKETLTFREPEDSNKLYMAIVDDVGTVFNLSVYPKSDNQLNLGDSNHRWKNAYVVNLYTGDIKLMNNWTVTERDENGEIIQNGVRILNDKGEEVFKVTEDGIYFKGKKIKLVFEE